LYTLPEDFPYRQRFFSCILWGEDLYLSDKLLHREDVVKIPILTIPVGARGPPIFPLG